MPLTCATQVGVNIIVPIVVLHELDIISRRGAGAAAEDATKAAAARCARSFLQRFLAGQRCSSGRERSSISLQEMMEALKSQKSQNVLLDHGDHLDNISNFRKNGSL